MKTHTSSFKEQIKLIGKEIDSRITFGSTVLGKDDLNAVTPSYQGAILKSVMKQLDIDSNVAIPIGTVLKYEFGLKVDGKYEYINYGNYVVYSVEKQEDTRSYKITCYDKLLYSMLDYVKLPITYPISIRDYINSLSTALGLKFANKSGTFANYNKQIQADLYDGLGYTFRDVLDELAQVTASTICLNNNDELEIRYITETNDTIDEEFLKDVNVNFGEKFGAVNTIVLSRSGDSDSVYYPPVLPANPYEIKISDNQIMNGNDRADFLPDIYEKLNGLEFYTNDFVSTGICYYDLCDRYSVKVGDNTYSCIMFNDEVLVTQGLEENIYTELPEQTETDYKHASKDDRMINQVYIIAKKNKAEILALVSTTENIQKEINPTKDESGSEITIEDASNNPLTYLEIEGKSIQDGTPTPDTPAEIESVGYENLIPPYEMWESGDISSSNNGTNINSTYYIRTIGYIKVKSDTSYSFSFLENKGTLQFSIYEYDENYNYITRIFNTKTFKTSKNSTNVRVAVRYVGSDPIITTNDVLTEKFMLNIGVKSHNYVSYGKYGVEVKTVGKNLFDKNNANILNAVINITTTDFGLIKSSNNAKTLYIEVKPNTTYTISKVLSKRFIVGTSEELPKVGVVLNNVSTFNAYTSATITTGANDKYLAVYYFLNGTDTITEQETLDSIQIEEGNVSTELEKYKSNKSVIPLNAPLRSLPNGVKDIAYIKNNKLYVDRYVGSVILNGSETWNIQSTWSAVGERTNAFYTPRTAVMNMTSGGNKLSSHFIFKNALTSIDEEGFLVSTNIVIRVQKNIATVDELRTWLSANNVKIIYELLTPYTEEISEIQMPGTFKGTNHILTTDELLPIINLTYVRDTIIADYVENHIAELKITEGEIKESVEKISSSVDGLNTSVNRVEEITNDNSQVINIISKNIDKTSGEVREVTTTTGFTFNKDGMTIDDGSGFKAEHRANGTYYKDGTSIVGQYTKDGSKQKDLELFGTYSYGKESIDDTPMFVGQLYNDESGEECFGHFYNGGDY